MSEPGTSYTAEIVTPSGLTFHASIYVPPDAEHADQHESAERAAYAVTRMLADHERGEEARNAEAARRASRCPSTDCYGERGHPGACPIPPF